MELAWLVAWGGKPSAAPTSSVIRELPVTGQHMEQTKRDRKWGLTCTVSIGNKIEHASLNYPLGNCRQWPCQCLYHLALHRCNVAGLGCFTKILHVQSGEHI